MKNSIAIILEAPFTKRDYDRYGISEFEKRGISIQLFGVWDLTLPHMARIQEEQFEELSIIDVASRYDTENLSKQLEEHDLVIVVFGQIGITYRTFPIYRAVSKSGRPTLAMMPNYIPGADRMPGSKIFGGRVSGILKRLFQGEIDLLNSLTTRIPIGWLGIRPLTYVVYGGEHSLKLRHPIEGPNTRNIFAHAMDFDHYLDYLKNPTKVESIAVFIDQYYPFHPDWHGMGLKCPIQPDDYYTTLRNLFDAVESKTGLNVVIAAHPRSDYENRKDLFGERPFYKGETEDLIAKSKLVLFHFSSGIHLAVMHAKPILQILFRKMHNYSFYESPLKAIKDSFRQAPLYIDVPVNISGFDFKECLKKDRTETYREYMVNYIKQPSSPNRKFWEIVCDVLSKDGIFPHSNITNQNSNSAQD